MINIQTKRHRNRRRTPLPYHYRTSILRIHEITHSQSLLTNLLSDDTVTFSRGWALRSLVHRLATSWLVTMLWLLQLNPSLLPSIPIVICAAIIAVIAIEGVAGMLVFDLRLRRIGWSCAAVIVIIACCFVARHPSCAIHRGLSVTTATTGVIA